MAIQAPPAPPVAPQLPPPVKTGRSCLGCGCGGCLLAIVLVVLLVVGGGYYFFVVQAQAAVPSPAALLVISTPVDVDTDDAGFHVAQPGQELKAGNSVRTGVGGHASIQFPDGSYVRMAPSTEVKVTAAQLSHDGNLQSASLQQKVGRTFTNVQHLVSGATFQVGGHSVSASVRGTQFEVLVRADNTNLIKVFDGTVKVTGAGVTITLTAGQQVEADATGKLAVQGAIKPEPQDPYAQSSQCARAVSNGTTAGTTQTSNGDNLTSGKSAEVDYYSPGGTVSVALCYPGSLMTVTVIDPNGAQHTSRQGAPPVQLNLNGPSGLYKAIIRGISLPPEGEPFSVSFATATPCGGESVDTADFVRQTINNQQISEALRQSGVTLQVQGTSSNSARVSYYSDLGKVPIAWTILFYAATPDVGFVLTQFTVRGVNVTTGVVSKLSSVTGSAQAVPPGFIVDRVYSCNGPGGGQMVVEGHH
jgi:FecR-like protein